MTEQNEQLRYIQYTYLAFPQIDWEVDELAVLLHKVLDTMWLQVLMSLFLEM